MNTIAEANLSIADNYPSLVRRFQSLFIDTLFIILAMVIISAILNYIPDTPDWIRITLFIFLFGCYEPVFIAFTKGTIGNKLMRIQVKQFNKERKRPNILQAYLRFIFKFFLGWISFLTMHFNPQKRAIHDLVANSVMIQN
jgi:uncharacterized RDD family membrane protein YckC